MGTACQGKARPAHEDVADEAALVAALVDEVVVEGLGAATLAVRDKILLISRKVTKVRSASSVLHLDTKGNKLLIRLMRARTRLCSIPKCKIRDLSHA